MLLYVARSEYGRTNVHYRLGTGRSLRSCNEGGNRRAAHGEFQKELKVNGGAQQSNSCLGPVKATWHYGFTGLRVYPPPSPPAGRPVHARSANQIIAAVLLHAHSCTLDASYYPSNSNGGSLL